MLDRCGLPTRRDALPAGVTADALLEAMEKVRLIRAGSLRWVLPVALGETVIADDVTERRGPGRARRLRRELRRPDT